MSSNQQATVDSSSARRETVAMVAMVAMVIAVETRVKDANNKEEESVNCR